MKISKQLVHLMSGKASKTAKYQNLAIGILTVSLLPCTIATALASNSRANIRRFDSATQQSSVGNITHKQIFSKAPTILVADARNSSEEDIVITSYRQGFDKAWQEKDRKKSLFTVCNEDNKQKTLFCIEVLETYLKQKISSWTNECYKQRANLVSCLEFFQDKGTTLKDLEQWINESQILAKEIIDAPD